MPKLSSWSLTHFTAAATAVRRRQNVALTARRMHRGILYSVASCRRPRAEPDSDLSGRTKCMHSPLSLQHNVRTSALQTRDLLVFTGGTYRPSCANVGSPPLVLIGARGDSTNPLVPCVPQLPGSPLPAGCIRKNQACVVPCGVRDVMGRERNSRLY